MCPQHQRRAAALVAAAAGLHLGFVEVAPAAHERIAHPALVVAERGPVHVVELFDDLERPAAVEDVAADQLALDLAGQAGVLGTQRLEHVVERQVGLAEELVEGVQVPAGALERLERFAHLPGGLDGAVADARGAGVVGHEPLSSVSSRCARRSSTELKTFDAPASSSSASLKPPVSTPIDRTRAALAALQSQVESPIMTASLADAPAFSSAATIRSGAGLVCSTSPESVQSSASERASSRVR